MARINESTGIFSVIECNNFKQITHISLQLRQGNDASIKAYLASRLNHMCSVVKRNTSEIISLNETLDMERSAKNDMSQELNELRTHRDVDMQSIRATHTEALSRQAVQASEVLDAERSARADEISRIRNNHDEYIASSNEKLLNLENLYSEEQTKRAKLEFKIRELTRDLDNSNLDRESLVSNAKKIDAAHREMTSKSNEMELSLAQAREKISGLEKQIDEKRTSLLKADDLIKAAYDAKSTSDEKVTAYYQSLQGLKDKLQSAVSEINKGNQVISSLQTDAQRSREIITTKNEVLRRQESLVTELRGRAGEAERRMDLANDTLSAKESELANTNREFDITKERLKESAEIISSNQEVITWLNRELSRFQLGVPGIPTYSVMNDKPFGIPNNNNGGGKENNNSTYSPMPTKGGSPYTDVTDITDSTKSTRMGNNNGGNGGISNISNNTSKGHHCGGIDYKDSYEYLRAVDGLGGMEDIGMEQLGLESGSSVGGTGGYYAGLLDVGSAGMTRSTNASSSNKGYEWQKAEFGLEE